MGSDGWLLLSGSVAGAETNESLSRLKQGMCLMLSLPHPECPWRIHWG